MATSLYLQVLAQIAWIVPEYVDQPAVLKSADDGANKPTLSRAMSVLRLDPMPHLSKRNVCRKGV
jgi:hypothetical protein